MDSLGIPPPFHFVNGLRISDESITNSFDQIPDHLNEASNQNSIRYSSGLFGEGLLLLFEDFDWIPVCDVLGDELALLGEGVDGVQAVDGGGDVAEDGRARNVFEPLQIADGAFKHAVHKEEDDGQQHQSAQEPRIHQHDKQDCYADRKHVLQKLFRVGHQTAVGYVSDF